jgi:hypothetical protein
MIKAAARALLVLPLALASASDADASGARKSKRSQANSVTAARTSSGSPTNGYKYYERIEDRVPFGTRIWWDVYASMPRGG